MILASADSLGSGAVAFTGTSTLQVGSDLTLADGVTLQSGATGTINTNGRDVTVSGVISGEGNLTKTGIGTLTLSNGANSFSGNIVVSQGTLKSTAVWSNPNCSMGVISKAGGRTLTVMPGAELYLGTNDSFGGCASLQAVNIPSTVTAIGDSAFSSCDLQSLELPYGLKSIGRCAFRARSVRRSGLP